MFVLIVNRSIAISNICSDAQGNGSNIKNNEVPVQKKIMEVVHHIVFVFYYITKKDFLLKQFCKY